jgi:hypothetical protein
MPVQASLGQVGLVVVLAFAAVWNLMIITKSDNTINVMMKSKTPRVFLALRVIAFVVIMASYP